MSAHPEPARPTAPSRSRRAARLRAVGGVLVAFVDTRPRAALGFSIAMATALAALISLISGVGLHWLTVLVAHGACSGALLYALLLPGRLVAQALTALDRGLDAIERRSLRVAAGVAAATLAWMLLAAQALGSRWELHAFRGGLASSMAIPHVLLLAWLALAPALLIAIRAALRPRRIAFVVLALNQVFLAVTLSMWWSYHPGIRDRPFPAFCGRGKAIVSRPSAARYSVQCDARSDSCTWTELKLGGSDTPGLLVRANLTSGALQSIPLTLNVPIAVGLGPDGFLWVAGSMRGDEGVDLLTGRVETRRSDTLEHVGSFDVDYAPTWFERETTTGRFFGAGLRGQEESVLTVHEPNGRVLTRVPMPTGGIPHLAAATSGIVVAAGWEIAILDADGRVVRRHEAPAVSDVAYDRKRDEVWMVSPTGRLLRVDVGTLEQRESHRVPFGSRYVVVDAAHDRVLVGNPVLPSVVVLPIDAPTERRVVSDVPVGVRAFSFAGERALYTCRCGIYELDVSRGRRMEGAP